MGTDPWLPGLAFPEGGPQLRNALVANVCRTLGAGMAFNMLLEQNSVAVRGMLLIA